MMPEDEIFARTVAVCDSFAQDVIEDIQGKLSVAYPPSSTPGESPHRRTGNLRAGISYNIERNGSLITLTIISAAPYSAPLETGTKRFGERPFMRPAFDAWEPVLLERLGQAFSGSNSGFYGTPQA